MVQGTSGTPITRNRMSAVERRQQLAEAAAQQFHRVGFHAVTIADVAASVGLTPPAIYRHFTNKQALLAAAIDSGLARVEATVTNHPDANWGARLNDLAAIAVERRDLWMLLQREIRHLTDVDRAPLEKRFAQFTAGLRVELRATRPDLDPRDAALIVTAVLAVFASQSAYPTRYSAADRRRVLVEAAKAVAETVLPTVDAQVDDSPRVPTAPVLKAEGEGEDPAHLSPSGRDSTRLLRSEGLLSTSIRLFHERGYAAVSLDDIGAEVGMAGPSIYHHFATKADLLLGAFTRATDWLATRRNSAETNSLDQLVRIYVDLGVRERLLLGVYVLEAASLPPADARRVRAALDADVDAWSAALHQDRPTLSGTERAILVQAARAVVHDVVRVGHFHDRPAIGSEMEALLHAVLNASLASGSDS